MALFKEDFVNPDTNEDMRQVSYSLNVSDKVNDSTNEPSTSDNGKSQPICTQKCICCFNIHPYDSLVHCINQHCICSECMNAYVKEAIFTLGKSNVECAEYQCTKLYTDSELQRVLEKDVWKKLDESSNSQTKNDEMQLYHCPECNFACELQSDIEMVTCMNCAHQSCRHCRIQWDCHVGRSCDELRNSDAIRLEYEEKMTKVVVRECPKCKLEVLKSEGCNHLTCRCGCEFCYVCGKKIISYRHFYRSKCKHFSGMSERDLGKRIRKLQEEAKSQKRRLGLDENDVGPSSVPLKKGRKRK